MHKAVLIVESSKDMRELYTTELQADGYDVVTVANRHEALGVVQRKHIDLVCLPTTDNREETIDLLSELIKNAKNLKIVIGSTQADCHLDFRTWLADAWVKQSDDLSELKKTIGELLARSKGAKTKVN